MISLGPRLLFEFPPSTSSRAETQQQPWSQGNHLSAPCGIIYNHNNNCGRYRKAEGGHERSLHPGTAVRGDIADRQLRWTDTLIFIPLDGTVSQRLKVYCTAWPDRVWRGARVSCKAERGRWVRSDSAGHCLEPCVIQSVTMREVAMCLRIEG